MGDNLINILWLAKSEYPSGSSLTPHSHDYYQIYYVISGEGDFIVGSDQVTLHRGMYVFSKPNDVHGIATTRDVNGEPLRMLEVKYVVFDAALQENLNHIPLVCQGSDSIEQMLALVFEEAIETLPWYLEIATHTFVAALYYMIRYQKIDLVVNSSKSEIVEMIKNYIHENYKNEVTLDKLSQLVGRSKNWICKNFKQTTGMTINLYLNKVRIDKAAELLVNSNLGISDISRAVGYNNIYHFINSFKKIVGTSPGNFRKHELSGNALVSSKVRAIATIPAQKTRSDV
ncbi:AraC family transcriptional regulator [Alicyclobacillus cycloheptanicus]|jgi:AraC-like DNA-binding protein|uniref:AraC-like DNA-binding protein n=1 Tax=Alicyclobacillus cycloheptanicus TaxID=1457 RepID=A0ABT9XK02_9BACL|nr:AraC family transcriptional regulator [Alicyclobacillus cycloheptanicus]MDQ0190369.1 AraC-like DNA-binding protein [Alicyclobacillus cycloheptanicus]WDL99998.1 AraC family transcriptional regulator [Alicyclobacillus cycloheptanicus]